MTTLEESIYLMDYLRGHGEIGVDCLAEDGYYKHHPEYCQVETRDYSEWEHELRSEGPAGQRAYALIRRAAERTCQEEHGDHWTKAETITRRVTELLSLSNLREVEVPTETRMT